MGSDLFQIKSSCYTLFCELDDFLYDPEIIKLIPRDRLVVTVCETGSRDKILMRYLSRYGYKNIMGLRFGMRGWTKNNFPVVSKTENSD
jgi:rhodanese-related sulfurtransferase